MKIITLAHWISVFALIALISSCSEGEERVPTPPTEDDLSFTYTVDAENPNLVHFTGTTSVDTWYTHWNFGDNTGDEGLDANKVFFKKGEYEVRFKIFTDGGTASVTQLVNIEADFAGPDLIKNGSFDTDEFWSIVSISGGVELAISDGKVKWSGGSWGNAAIYQQVEIEADKEYQINMDISGSGMSDSWFEVFIGQFEPQDGVDYSDGGNQMGLNTWEGCGSEAFNAQLTDIACVGNGGSFTWSEAGLAYFLIKCGGGDLGAEGVTIDNIAIRSI